MTEISIKATALCLVFAYAEMSVIRDFSNLLKKIDDKMISKLKGKKENISI